MMFAFVCVSLKDTSLGGHVVEDFPGGLVVKAPCFQC